MSNSLKLVAFHRQAIYDDLYLDKAGVEAGPDRSTRCGGENKAGLLFYASIIRADIVAIVYTGVVMQSC